MIDRRKIAADIESACVRNGVGVSTRKALLEIGERLADTVEGMVADMSAVASRVFLDEFERRFGPLEQHGRAPFPVEVGSDNGGAPPPEGKPS